MQNQKISRGGRDQHFGTVWCQPHSHKKTGVKKFLVGTSIFCAPGQWKKHKKWLQSAWTLVPNNVQKSPRYAKHQCSSQNCFWVLSLSYLNQILMKWQKSHFHTTTTMKTKLVQNERTTFCHVTKKSSLFSYWTIAILRSDFHNGYKLITVFKNVL